MFALWRTFDRYLSFKKWLTTKKHFLWIVVILYFQIWKKGILGKKKAFLSNQKSLHDKLVWKYTRRLNRLLQKEIFQIYLLYKTTRCEYCLAALGIERGMPPHCLSTALSPFLWILSLCILYVFKITNFTKMMQTFILTNWSKTQCLQK